MIHEQYNRGKGFPQQKQITACYISHTSVVRVIRSVFVSLCSRSCELIQ